MRQRLLDIGKDLLGALDTGPEWIDEQLSADPNKPRPLFFRLILDHHKQSVIENENSRSILGLVTYYKALPEYTDDDWQRRRANILGKDWAAFHTTLAELALHEGLRKRFPEIEVRLRATRPGMKTSDYFLTFGTETIEAELKSNLSEAERMTAGEVYLGSASPDADTRRRSWQRFMKPFREGQLQSERSVVFLDVTACDEMFINLSFGLAVPALRANLDQLLRNLANSGPKDRPSDALFVLCAFDPVSFVLRSLIGVPGEAGQ